MTISTKELNKVALSREEYNFIVQKLGREPTEVELGMFGSLWSEHCGYKYSAPLLKLLPSRGERVLVGPGEENAGVVDIGDGQVVVMKIESHNHPSAIEPYQGAATGVGGIVRDIFTMGARPVALLNSLRFGPLENEHNRYLFNGVVGGIAGYGNCLGIPNVGGEIVFANCYSGNPLVNALCLGIAEKGKLMKAQAGAAGNVLMLVGADTGRDGIHGASGLASRTFDGEQELRPTVQVGNPFLEKLLIEACLELVQADWVLGMQDLGAAGLTSSVIESVAKAGKGVVMDVLRVSRREEGMTPYEVMLSESQERMLVIVREGCEDKVKVVLERWDLCADVIGQVTEDGLAVIREGEKVVASVPVSLLSSPPRYRRQGKKPLWLEEVQSWEASSLLDLTVGQCNETLLRLLSSPNIASKETVYRQYDHQVMNNSVVLPGEDAAVLRVRGTEKGLSLTCDGNGRYCYLDPCAGGAIAVAEAARNLVCSGARPLALTDCLNFGNPEKDDVYYQMEECIKGMAQACDMLQIPVISGNVSLYNETRGEAIYPTPVVGMVGVIRDLEKRCTMPFKDKGDRVFLLGGEGDGGIGGSEYLEVMHGLVKGKPAIDLDREKQVQQCCLEAIERGIIKSAHDCADGGLMVAVAECCITGGIGLSGKEWCVDDRLDVALFGEQQGRIIISVAPDAVTEIERLACKYHVFLDYLGQVGGEQLSLEEYICLPVEELAKAWRRGI